MKYSSLVATPGIAALIAEKDAPRDTASRSKASPSPKPKAGLASPVSKLSLTARNSQTPVKKSAKKDEIVERKPQPHSTPKQTAKKGSVKKSTEKTELVSTIPKSLKSAYKSTFNIT